jgi:polysaccharide biosynthesis/export protein
MKAFFFSFACCFLVILHSCSETRPQGYDVFGPQDFVCESQIIRQGKTAIKELEGHQIVPLPADAFDEYEDLIAEDDVLTIAIYHPTRRDLMDSMQFVNQEMEGFRVINGQVSLPCIEPQYVLGLTIEQARRLLRERMREQIRDIDLFVSYKDRLSHRVEITGLAQKAYCPVNGRVRLYEILANVKLAPEANLFGSYVMRDGVQLDLDLYKLINEGDMCQNIVMKAGDKIFIANLYEHAAMVMGEVGAPRPIPLPYGSMSLREALVMARGIPFTGDKNHIYVIRGNLPTPKIYVISWEFMLHQTNDDLLIMPGDIVYVCQKPITQWNLFISQLQSTFNITLLGADIYHRARR